MDIETGEASLLFDLRDNGDGELSLQELAAGTAKLKGTAQTFDLSVTQHRIHLRQQRVEDLARHARDDVGSQRWLQWYRSGMQQWPLSPDA